MVALTLATAQIGLYLVPANYHLTGPEIGYLLADSGAKALIAHERFAQAAISAADDRQLARFAVGAIDGFDRTRRSPRINPPTCPPSARPAR